MKERIAQLKSRYQNYSAREKIILKICAVAIVGAAVYYTGVIPLDNMIQNRKSTLKNKKRRSTGCAVKLIKIIFRSS